MRAYLIGYSHSHGIIDGHMADLIEQGGCEAMQDESLDVEYVTIEQVLEIIDELKRMEDELGERANRMEFVNHIPTGNPNEIKIVKLNAKADGIQYAREYLKKAILALKGGNKK